MAVKAPMLASVTGEEGFGVRAGDMSMIAQSRCEQALCEEQTSHGSWLPVRGQGEHEQEKV